LDGVSGRCDGLEVLHFPDVVAEPAGARNAVVVGREGYAHGIRGSIYFPQRRVAGSIRRNAGDPVDPAPWAEGKQHKTLPYLGFLASWVEDLPWQRVAKRFYTSWQSVYRAVQWVVEYGLEYRRFDNVSSIGVDEIQYLKGHKYLTVVYQFASGCRRLLWVW
jgi:hypothetical protein